MYARCTLGRLWNRRLMPATTCVTFENGRSLDPYPPATVSLLMKPSPPLTSARKIRMVYATSRSDRATNRTDHAHTRRSSDIRCPSCGAADQACECGAWCCDESSESA